VSACQINLSNSNVSRNSMSLSCTCHVVFFSLFSRTKQSLRGQRGSRLKTNPPFLLRLQSPRFLPFLRTDLKEHLTKVVMDIHLSILLCQFPKPITNLIFHDPVTSVNRTQPCRSPTFCWSSLALVQQAKASLSPRCVVPRSSPRHLRPFLNNSLFLLFSSSER
jgi:hypothetical protein